MTKESDHQVYNKEQIIQETLTSLKKVNPLVISDKEEEAKVKFSNFSALHDA